MAATEKDLGQAQPQTAEHPAPAAVTVPTSIEALFESVTWWEGVYDGQPLTKEQIISELHDYRMILPEVAKVYYEASGGKISKQNTHASEVIACMEQMITETVDDAVKEAREEWRAERSALLAALKAIDARVARMGPPAFATHGHEIRAYARAALAKAS